MTPIKRRVKPRNAAAKALPKFKPVRHKDRTKYDRKTNRRLQHDADT